MYFKKKKDPASLKCETLLHENLIPNNLINTNTGTDLLFQPLSQDMNIPPH